MEGRKTIFSRNKREAKVGHKKSRKKKSGASKAPGFNKDAYKRYPKRIQSGTGVWRQSKGSASG